MWSGKVVSYRWENGLTFISYLFIHILIYPFLYV